MNKYEDWDKKDLIEHIKKLEKKKKFGLTWEHKNDEGPVLFCKENLIKHLNFPLFHKNFI